MPVLKKPPFATVRCTRCGAEFSPESASCPACGRAAGTQSARITLAVTVLLIVAGMVFTRYFVNLHRATESSLANRWSTRGGQAMTANLPATAADDYRTALSYDPENQEYRLRLAQALLAADRLNEARAHLTSLWEQEPANGDVNLTLARLYTKRGDFVSASRYYDNAINGIWPGDTLKQRIAVRFELANYLMQQHRLTQAQSELMALLADAPPDPADQLRLGELLLQVQEPEHTIAIDDAVLAKNPSDGEAYWQKARALLSLNRLVDGERALAKAAEYKPNDENIRRQLTLLQEALRLDPARRGLSRTERADRVIEAFHIAWQRLTSCAAQRGMNFLAPPNAGPGDTASLDNANGPGTNSVPAPDSLQLLYSSGLQKQSGVTQKAMREDSDALESTTQFVFDVERATAPLCTQMSLSDQALLMLAQHDNEGPK